MRSTSGDVQLTGLRQGSIHAHNEVARQRFIATTLSLIAIVAATSCGDQTPRINDWETTWNNTVSVVDEASIPNVTQDECGDILAYLRVQRTVLSPVPLNDLETPVDAWFAGAEALFFECDLADDAAQQSLETLQALQGEVDAVLEVEG
jgi:hypothetical protein